MERVMAGIVLVSGMVAFHGELAASPGEPGSEAVQAQGDIAAVTLSLGADPEFYSFFRTLESYRSLGGNSTLMLRSDSDFFRYLEQSQAE